MSAIALVLSTGCASSGHNDPESSLHNGSSYGALNNKQVYNAIVKAGEEEGWKITPFKRSTVIAEDLNKENAEAVTISFNGGYIAYDGENYGDLEDAINEQIEKVSTPSH